MTTHHGDPPLDAKDNWTKVTAYAAKNKKHTHLRQARRMKKIPKLKHRKTRTTQVALEPMRQGVTIATTLRGSTSK
jgi:hypothetical protein